MPRLTSSLTVVNSGRYHDEGNSSFWTHGDCPECGRAQFLVVATTVSDGGRPDGHTSWLRCLGCRRALVVNQGVPSPQATALRSVAGLPTDIERAWAETRNCHAAGAATATVMMCRKILFHIAVEQGLPEKDSKGWAPNFKKVIEHLEAKGLVTPPMKPWVDKIKDIGNEANHDLAEISLKSASRVGTFTYQLLVLTYEMTATMTQTLDDEGEEAVPI